MKTIGLLGGMSWESTASYYRIINQETMRLRGGLHSAPIVLISVDFAEVANLQKLGDWKAAADYLIDKARQAETAGAECLLICTNTMHKVADEVQANISIPLLHIAQATATALVDARIKRVALLGTRFTMEDNFYSSYLEKSGLEVIVPDASDRTLIHDVIYTELCQGIFNDSSRQAFLKILNSLRAQGIEAAIEGCTEIALLLDQSHTELPLFDTAYIHAASAVRFALGNEFTE